jgi:hypothetical protein
VICTECGRVATDAAFGWRGYLTDDNELILYCAECAVRTSGPRRTRPLDAESWSPDFLRDYPRWVNDED